LPCISFCFSPDPGDGTTDFRSLAGRPECLARRAPRPRAIGYDIRISQLSQLAPDNMTSRDLHQQQPSIFKKEWKEETPDS